ncbi:hypothetical protein ASG22_04075 [Chryseobacterium sp. Leaf405]|uniref:hypothetical protein n=1 Tax=Chryseobacterium sp. Leaf405 TaxID=1736367 RepID=UPI0006FE6803|nr:hypothetical protein [Chryseobacterium sp. Leaf405]KQT25885.1 hypothetical protein ASG22_04075 [Chryseobacterium sp. Leaf405]
MKRIYTLTLLVLALISFQLSFAQSNTTIDTQYRMKPDRNVAKENNYFYFDVSQGKLYTNDKDLDIQKQYYIKFKNSFYDNGGLYNLGFETDVVQHTLNRRTKSELGAFAIIYDEKNGNIIGVRIVTEYSSEIYLTEFGAKFLNKI